MGESLPCGGIWQEYLLPTHSWKEYKVPYEGSYGEQWKMSAGRMLKSWKLSFTQPKLDLR
jgi:hypothetical protein